MYYNSQLVFQSSWTDIDVIVCVRSPHDCRHSLWHTRALTRLMKGNQMEQQGVSGVEKLHSLQHSEQWLLSSDCWTIKAYYLSSCQHRLTVISICISSKYLVLTVNVKYFQEWRPIWFCIINLRGKTITNLYNPCICVFWVILLESVLFFNRHHWRLCYSYPVHRCLHMVNILLLEQQVWNDFKKQPVEWSPFDQRVRA